MASSLEIVSTFTEDSLPTLDTVTLGALELFYEHAVPTVDFKKFKRPLVVGSGNALVTGRLLFDDVDAVFGDESSYLQKLETITDIDGAFLISASGSKHAIEIVKTLIEKKLEVVLLTNNTEAPAKEFLSDSSVCVYPKNREPYTYNTSTYMGMLLSKTHEDTQEIADFITHTVTPLISSNLSSYSAFYIIVPEHFSAVSEMFRTKFDELFGPKLMGRIFSFEQTKHAKTVIRGDRELFISFGVDNATFGNPEHRLNIPLPLGADYVAMMAIGYFVVGQIQNQFPPYYKERIKAYTQETSETFGSTITVIVE